MAFKTTQPITQYRTTDGWTAARIPGDRTVLAVLYRGQYIGWLTPTAAGWAWTNAAWRPRASRTTYSTWERAAAALSRTTIARDAGATAPATGFVAAVARPWIPRAA